MFEYLIGNCVFSERIIEILRKKLFKLLKIHFGDQELRKVPLSPFQKILFFD